MTGGEINYDRWYPEVPAVMDTRQLAGLLGTNVQIVRAWVREGIIPAHRLPGGRKLTFLRHEIFQWLIANRYEPTAEQRGR
ncbi:MAG: helix-turn-helix domain-containing protein [Actinobacteria bacterium]|nr:helix-turn-helix domain-containing protein [Actinomycetota bacterium]